MALFDKIRYTIAWFDSAEWAFLITGMLIFNLIIVAFLYTSLKSAMVGRERELEQERDKYKKYWEVSRSCMERSRRRAAEAGSVKDKGRFYQLSNKKGKRMG